MTGRDLILYILENGLENELVFKGGKFIGFLTIEEVAVKLDVGTATVNAWIQQKRLCYVNVGNVTYIPADFELKAA